MLSFTSHLNEHKATTSQQHPLEKIEMYQATRQDNDEK